MRRSKIILSVLYGFASIPMFYLFWSGGGIFGIVFALPSIFALLITNLAFSWLRGNNFNLAFMSLDLVLGTLYGYLLISLTVFLYRKSVSWFRRV